MSSAIANTETRASHAEAGRVLPALLAGMLGLLMLLGVGFSHISAVHNAAHDARHANGFPCH